MSNISKSGLVQDKNGEPLMGANILDRGDQYNGVVTDWDGGFSITGDINTSVIVSFLGFKSKEYELKKLPNIIKLNGDINNLDEVYLGTVKNKSDNTWLLILGLILGLATYFKK